MDAKLYVVNGSHPCATVERALQLKGIPYKIVEFPPPMHMAAMKVLFGERTGARAEARRREDHRFARRSCAGSTTCVPEPALLPGRPRRAHPRRARPRRGATTCSRASCRARCCGRRSRPIPRRWRRSTGSKLRRSRVPVLKLIAPVATRIEMKANDATDASYPADVRSLPDLLDKVDGWIADGVLGGEQPNAADLQIATSLRLLMALADLRPMIEPRPAGQLALRLFPDFPGDVAPGSIPAAYLPAPAAPERGAQPPAAASAGRRRGARPRRAAGARARR